MGRISLCRRGGARKAKNDTDEGWRGKAEPAPRRGDNAIQRSDKLKNFPQPKVLKATQKEKQIAAGAKRKSTDYPTMDEILSDWDENDEAANQLKKKASLDCVTAKNAVPNSAEQAVPVNVNNVVAIGKCFSISGWNRFV
ncbi:hypothetical protein Y032_0168g165 [Ancylostoma ceylanicum]|uniref:Uncharacterized protein n=1 Tax=Ancylostoma ceylanicum TaxID=53326 RepID=A0A016SVE3_9BILA|nr:hypothetical protein Y032_0168g165 [Ancylostoma ceylanicum]